MNLKLEAKKELAKRELAKRHFRYYVEYMFPKIYNKEYVFGDWHDKFFNALEKVRSGKLKRLMVFLPPRVGKTEIISKLFPSFILGEDPTKKIVCASYGADLAKDFGRKARQIVNMPEFRNIFKEFKLSSDKKEGGNWETNNHGGYYSVGVQGALTGKGFDIGIIDDPVKDRQEAESLLIRERTWDWYTSTFYTRKQSEDSAIIILQTRWNTDDLSGRILEANTDGFEVISFPALDEADGSFFPERFSSDFYINERENIGIRDFEALYQQDPIKSSGEIFKKADFRYFAMSDINKEDFEVGIFCDPAFSSRDGSDDVVVLTLARHKHTKEFYILDIWADTQTPSVSISVLINTALKWKSAGFTVRFISVEDVSLNVRQQIFVKQVDEEMRKQNVFITLQKYRPKGKKEDRLKYTLEPYFNRHGIHFRVDDSGNNCWRKLEEQLLKFPASRRDDIIDTLNQGVESFSKKEVEIKENNYRMEFVREEIRKNPLGIPKRKI